MPFRKVLFYFISLLLVVVGGGGNDDDVPLQFNLHFTKWNNNNENDLVMQHDCFRVDVWENKKDVYEIISYCMSEWSSKWQIETNHFNQKFTFAELSELNITSEELYLWSASMDTVEDYQSYLDEQSISNETLFSRCSYYNCTFPNFGPMCQYSFDQYASSYSSLNQIINQFYRIYKYEPKNQTCYINSKCDLGLTSLCIGWINICDGIVQCIDGIDEEDCWQLEINECREDEFRCKNGQCIPLSFLNDNSHAPDCLDGSDEKMIERNKDFRLPSGPLYKLEEISCWRFIRSFFIVIKGRDPQCFDSRFLESDNSVYFPQKPNPISDVCWLALNCDLRLTIGLNLNCNGICKNETCKPIIANNCPDMFYMPHAPVAFGHIYFAYTKKYIIEQNTWTNAPEYVCYNERLCGGFLPNGTLVSFNNTTCRRPQDFSLQFDHLASFDGSLLPYIEHVYMQLYKCNTILRNDLTFCNNSTMYQCLNSSKCIAQIRRFDGKYDCDYKDDELWTSADHSCPINSPQMYVNCTETKKCISRKLINDLTCQCQLDLKDMLCDDEPSELDYIKRHIFFPSICDNSTYLKPIFINGQNETDETACEQWPCNNIYTRCNGIWNCFNGEDELDCYPSSLINCSLRSYVCFSPETADYMCLSGDKLNDGNIDCLGNLDEPQCCGKSHGLIEMDGFYCNTTKDTGFSPLIHLCYGKQHCWQEEDEKLCHHKEIKDLFPDSSVCRTKVTWKRSDVEEFLCNLFVPDTDRPIGYFSLDKMRNPDQRITNYNINMELTSFLPTIPDLRSSDPCYRSPSFRIWLNDEENPTRVSCLCPSGYYGDKCQFQNERVSLTIRFRAFSDSWQTPFIVIVSLIDNSTERTIHSHEQFTYLPVLNCRTKFNIDLLYSTRPKDPSKQYSVHIDVYEKVSLSYRGSLLLSFPFPFLPVQRIATQLSIPRTGHNFKNCPDQRCGHGQCVQYFDHPKNTKFCQCQSEWSGRYCNISHLCTCSSDSLCIGIKANNRSICVCPKHKWGSRCLLHNRVCQSNVTCHNGGQCMPVDKDIVSKKKFQCLCPKGFSGETCQIAENKIILSFEKDMILLQSMLIHFIEVKANAYPENGSTFKTIPTDRNPVTIYWSRPFHIAFVEFVRENYYLIVLENDYNQSQTIERTLKSSNRCPNISEVFNETFFQLHLIRRIKSYHLPCQQHSPQLSCFYDDVHLCLCHDYNQQRQANCLEFNHRLQRNCRGQSNCQNGASCLQDSVNCPSTSMCICPSCFYGTRCQFSSSGFGLSLDGILGDHIQVDVNIRYQPTIVKISLTLTVVMTVMGLLNGICSLMTFMNKEPRKIGCGYYLIGSSITTLIITTIFCTKFSILVAVQMTYMTNRSFLIFQCRSIDFLLQIGLHMGHWLNACVAIERAIVVKKGISFDKSKSRKIAKFVIPILFLLITGTNVHEIIYRRLLDDDNNDEKRIWCIIDYPVYIQKYNLAMNIIHFCTPFVINLLSAIFIIMETTRLRINVKTEQNYRKVLFEKLLQHKHILITPLLLIILAIPRLIISLASGCMQTAGDTWLFLMGYFISFIPPIMVFFIFVVPSQTYKEEFFNTWKRYQRSMRTYFQLFR